MSYWGDGWMDGFLSWEEVEDCLSERWSRVDLLGWGLCLVRDGQHLLAVEQPGRWRARHRRGLHRLGFRPLAARGRTVWWWDVQQQLRDLDLDSFADPAEAVVARATPGRRQRQVLLLRTLLATEQLMLDQAQRVLRDVFRAAPGEIAVLLVPVEEVAYWPA